MRTLKLILINLAVVISLFLLTELLARGYFYLKHKFFFKESFLYEGDETLGFKINSRYRAGHGKYFLGMRKDLFEIEKKDKVRIICLGGSTTFGHNQVDNSKVWPEILERLLNSKNEKRYEVLNAGVPGYGSSNLVARLKKDILSLEPDMVIIFSGWNLVGCLKSRYGWVPENVYFKKHPFLQRINNLLVNNSLVYLKMNNFITSKMRIRNNEISEEKINKIYKSELPTFARDLEEMIAICKRNKITPILIKYPAKDDKNQRYLDTVNMVEKIALENMAYLIDGASYFKSLEDKDRAEYFTDIAHFSDKGNEKIAQIIFSALIDQGLAR